MVTILLHEEKRRFSHISCVMGKGVLWVVVVRGAAGGEEGQLVVICFYPGGVCIISWGRFNSRVGFVGPPPPPPFPNTL